MPALTTPPAIASAVAASLRLVDLGPPEVSFPLLATTVRAVFGEPDFGVHVSGETGTFKSEVVALYQQHFGAGLDRLHLPGSWSSTANSIEALAFQAKDALLTIDDFAPQGSAGDIQRYHAAADRVFRAAGNHAGRGRLDSSTRLREPKPPRAMILSTGEEIPRGHSVRARLLILEVARGSISSDELSQCQKDARAGLYAQAMSAFLQWFASRYEDARSAFDRIVSERRAVQLDKAHARTPEITANLGAAFELYLNFACESGAIDGFERDRLANRCRNALRDAALAQIKHQEAIEPTERFLSILRSLLTSGRGHFESKNGGIPDGVSGACGWKRDGAETWSRMGDNLGWLDGDDLYLDPEAAYRAIQVGGRDAGESLPIALPTLKKRLKEKGLLASVDQKRQTHTIRRTICGSTRDVLHLSRDTLLPPALAEEEQDVG